MNTAKRSALTFAIATALSLSAGSGSYALPGGPRTAETGTIMSDIIQVASKKSKNSSAAYNSYGSYRPNPAPSGSWHQSGGGGSDTPPPASQMASDSRLKEAVVPLKQLANGVELYRFRYKGESEVYVGVIAQQVARLMPGAVVRGDDGYLRVDYDRVGVKLMTWAEWQMSQAAPH